MFFPKKARVSQISVYVSRLNGFRFESLTTMAKDKDSVWRSGLANKALWRVLWHLEGASRFGDSKRCHSDKPYALEDQCLPLGNILC